MKTRKALGAASSSSKERARERHRDAELEVVQKKRNYVHGRSRRRALTGLYTVVSSAGRRDFAAEHYCNNAKVAEFSLSLSLSLSTLSLSFRSWFEVARACARRILVKAVVELQESSEVCRA